MFSPFPFPSCVSILYLHISVRPYVYEHDVTDHLITTPSTMHYAAKILVPSFYHKMIVYINTRNPALLSNQRMIELEKSHIKFNQDSNIQHRRNCPFPMVTKNKRFLFIQRKESNSISRSRSRYPNAKNVLSILYIYIFITLRSSKMLCLRFTLGDTLP